MMQHFWARGGEERGEEGGVAILERELVTITAGDICT